MSGDIFDPGLITELHAQLEAARNLSDSWRVRADAALRIAESHGKELADLRATLEVEPTDLEHEARSSAFWFSAWREMRRLRAEDQLRLRALEREVAALRCGDLSKFMDEQLDAARAQAFRDHLPGCKRCTDGLHDLMAVEAIMSDAPRNK